MRTGKLKVGVIGVGHLGKEHARVYSKLNGVELTAVCDTIPERAKEIGEKYNAPYFTDYHQILDKVDAASIVVPTISHFEVAIDFLKRGIPALIEKPLAKTVDEAQELVKVARENKTTLQVGHIERFNPALCAVKDIIKMPRFIECHRLSQFKFRSIDIDVVKDLMIHDIDIILHMAKSPIKKIDAVGVALLFQNEDIANARIEFEDGCVANVTASRISDKAMRKIRIFSEGCYISLDYTEKTAKVYKISKELSSVLMSKKHLAIPTEIDLSAIPKSFYSVEDITIEDYEPLAKEIEAFIYAVKNKTEPVVPGEHGLQAMKVAAQILQEIRMHTWK